MQNIRMKMEAVRAEGDLYMLPFQLGSEIVLVSVSNPALKATLAVYGAVPGRMIIIEEPRFTFNERLTDQPGEFVCAHLYGNHILKFRSNFIKHLLANVIGIDYPDEVERVQIRSSTRIAVSIETEILLGTKYGTISGRMVDISRGGCRLELPRLIQTRRGSKLYLSFTLPDNQSIDNLACAVMLVRHLSDKTVVGVKFPESTQAIMKVEKFCKLFATAQVLTYMN